MLFIPLSVYSQEKDFGIWYGISAEHKLAKKLTLDLSTNIRTFENASKIEEAFIEGGVTYNLYKNLSVAGSYRLTKSLENNNSYYLRHKYFFDLKGTIPVGDFSISCRLRYQSLIKNYIQHEVDKYPSYTGRIKVKLVYHTKTFPINPYVYIESFCPMFSKYSGTIGKNRYSAGLEFKITRRQSLETEYIFQRDYEPHISDINIIYANWNIKF
jgi:hypothetical protein